MSAQALCADAGGTCRRRRHLDADPIGLGQHHRNVAGHARHAVAMASVNRFRGARGSWLACPCSA
jgi:hypothetical protein